MFGLMKVSTHEAAMLRVEQRLNAVKAERNELLIQKTRKITTEAEVVTLKAQLQETTFDRDAWKKSEFDCNTQYNKLQVENVALKARIAELEKPVPLPKRKPVVKASPVKETVKVPVKGKVEAKSGKVTK